MQRICAQMKVMTGSFISQFPKSRTAKIRVLRSSKIPRTIPRTTITPDLRSALAVVVRVSQVKLHDLKAFVMMVPMRANSASSFCIAGATCLAEKS